MSTKILRIIFFTMSIFFITSCSKDGDFSRSRKPEIKEKILELATKYDINISNIDEEQITESYPLDSLEKVFSSIKANAKKKVEQRLILSKKEGNILTFKPKYNNTRLKYGTLENGIWSINDENFLGMLKYSVVVNSSNSQYSVSFSAPGQTFMQTGSTYINVQGQNIGFVMYGEIQDSILGITITKSVMIYGNVNTLAGSGYFFVDKQ